MFKNGIASEDSRQRKEQLVKLKERVDRIHCEVERLKLALGNVVPVVKTIFRPQ